MDRTNLGDLKADPENPRRHNPRNLAMLRRSLEEFGPARSIVVDEQGNIIAGNGTVQAALEAGLSEVIVIPADRKALVAVQMKGLTEEEKRRLAVLDNRTTDLSDWDLQVLAELVNKDETIGDLWKPDELEALFKGLDYDVTPTALPEPTLSSAVLIEIRCTKEALEGMTSTLEEWNERADVQINIS